MARLSDPIHCQIQYIGLGAIHCEEAVLAWRPPRVDLVTEALCKQTTDSRPIAPMAHPDLGKADPLPAFSPLLHVITSALVLALRPYMPLKCPGLQI